MRSWSESFRAFLSPRVISMLFLGFSAGLPLLLVFSTLSIWLREAGVERATIGFFSWAALAYGFKVVWAPVVDRLPLPVLDGLLGRRRAWILTAQLAIVAALLLKAFNDPADNLPAAALFAVMLAFASATQDIVIDAYRIESAPLDLQGLMSATYIAGYRLGMIVAGAGALEIAAAFDPDPDSYQFAPWTATWLAMAGVMSVGIATTLLIREPARDAATGGSVWAVGDYVRFLATFATAAGAFFAIFAFSHDLSVSAKAALAGGVEPAGPLSGLIVEATRLLAAVAGAVLTGLALVRAGVVPRAMAHETYVAPFADFFGRFGSAALLVLALVATYRIADVVMGVMANVFYVDLGFEKQEIGRISGGFGLVMTIFGGFVGGLLITHYGVMRMLFAGAVLAAGTNILFALLATIGPSIPMLMAVIAADNLSGGMASAAFVAYLSGLTSTRFTATQYALFTSLMLLLPKLIAGYSGMVVDSVGYARFFIGTAVLGAPVLLLVLFAGGLSTARDGTRD